MNCLVACVWLGGVVCLGLGFVGCRSAAAEDATPISSIVVQEGFEVELLRSAQEGEDSWISMTFDDRGRILLGLDSKGVARVEIDQEGGETTFERVEDTFKHCRGVLYAHDSLYVSATNDGGLYRLRDTDGDDQFDDVQLLKSFDYRSRYGHGANQLVLGPDDMIYMAVGNDVSFPEGASPNSPYRDPQNDWLVPNPHDAGEDDRVGYILRFDPDGKSWEILAGGLRNQVDVAFNPDGEMFTYDADMEWDAGLPWYRPNRLIHVVSAGEYGWRWGTGKWPAYYADSLPSLLDTGLASPTGMEFGTASRFPLSHRNSLFMADWQNGRILQVRMMPEGASYQAEYEVFVEGGPLNVCDLTFGPDGNLYFITGGRGSHSGLYRVRYRGATAAEEETAETESRSAKLVAAAEARQLRQQLEAFHTREAAGAVDFAWPHLGSSDRWIRYAARVAVERQPLEQWRERAVAEHDSLRSVTALMALARVGEPSDQPPLLAALGRLPLEELDRDSLLAALRVYALSFVRQGRPDAATVSAIGKRLEAMYPHASPTVNQELCELLLYLQTHHVVETTLQLLEEAATQEEQIHYASMLVRPSQTEHAIAGWDREAHAVLLRWLGRAVSFPGGHLMDSTMAAIRDDALARLSDQDRAALADLIAALEKPKSDEPRVPPRPFVRQWTMEDLLPELDRISSGRSYESARAALAAASCLRCHRLGDEGGRIGPDLTTVARRFDNAALLESILEPSRVIDPKYRHTAYLLDSGQIVQGRPAGVNAKELKIEIDPLTGESVSIDRAAVEASRPSEVSPMPTGLVDTLTAEEILDLLAYLRAEGNRQAANFQ